jgi:hypothetical protein
MINSDDLNSSCCSGLSDGTESSLSNFDPAAASPKRDLNRVYLPPDKVVELISAFSSNPKAFIKPLEKRKV